MVATAFVPSSTSSATLQPTTTRTAGTHHRPLHLHEDNSEDADVTQRVTSTTHQPTPVLFQNKNWNKAGAQLAAAASLATLLSTTALPADAAMSGGRMGGSFSRSGGGGGYSRMAPSRSYGGGGGGGYYRGGGGPMVMPYIAPMPIITPFYNPIVPFGGGVGAISYHRGPGLFDLLFLGGLGWFALSTLTSVVSGRSNANQWDDGYGTSVFSSPSSSALGSGTSVIKLSVALDVPNRDDPYSLLSVLDRLSETANTGSRKGVQNLTSQVAVELLRRKSAIQSASSNYQHVKDDGQRLFNQWSVQERSKFEQETVSKFGGIDTSSMSRRLRGEDTGSSKATMAVVTLVLSVQGDSTKIPSKIRSLADVEDALRRIAADVKVDDCLTGAEILWTPQDRSETLTRMEVVADYPELNTV